MNAKNPKASEPELNPAWLLETPLLPNLDPPVETRGHMLPLSKLTWKDFERMCCRLAGTAGNVEQTHAYGTPGQAQFGIDVLVRLSNGEFEVWQTKRYQSAKAADIDRAINIFLEHKWANQATKCVLAFSCSLQAVKVVEAIESARDRLKEKNICLVVHGDGSLSHELIGHPLIIDAFFGREWVKHVCPPEALVHLESQFPISAMDANGNTSAIWFPNGLIEQNPTVASALSAQTLVLQSIAEEQKDLATKADLAVLAQKLSGSNTTGAQQIILPADLADKLINEGYQKCLRRRGFPNSNAELEFSTLADRVIEGDSQNGSTILKAEVCERSARVFAASGDRQKAEYYKNSAVQFDASRNLFVVDAFLREASGDVDGALRDLRNQNNIDGNSTAFDIIMKARGVDQALAWLKGQGLEIGHLAANVCFNFIAQQIVLQNYDLALVEIGNLPDAYFSELVALTLLRGRLRLTSILPEDHKSWLFEGFPINPKQIQLASGRHAQNIAKAALLDLQSVLQRIDELDLKSLSEMLSEMILWLRLEITEFHDAALRQLRKEIKDPTLTLRRVSLALSYNVLFDIEALKRNLESRKQNGGWTQDELFASLRIALNNDPSDLTLFFEKHHEEIYEQNRLSHVFLAAIEIEALAYAGRFDDARIRLESYKGSKLNPAKAEKLAQIIAAIENGDELETCRKNYEDTRQLSDLRELVARLRQKGNRKLLADYAPTLARQTRQHDDFDVAIKSLFNSHRDFAVISLVDEMPQIAELDMEYKSLKGWSLLRLGRVIEARKIARELLSDRGHANDRELAINTDVASGDWAHLHVILSDAIGKIDHLTADEAMRLARFACEIGSLQTDKFRDDALSKAPDSAHINLTAYQLNMECGIEDESTNQYLQKAIEASGESGPVRSYSLPELVTQASVWNEQSREVAIKLVHAEIPIFVAARGLRRQLIDLMLGQAFRNVDREDNHLPDPIIAFSGSKPAANLKLETVIALDITSIFTLHFLELLDVVLSSFHCVVISPQTLNYLFTEQQFIKVNQPTEIEKAKHILGLISAGKLKLLDDKHSQQNDSEKLIGRELTQLLETAREKGGVVVRSAPVPKVGSYLDEHVDMDLHHSVLADTKAVLRLLVDQGKIDTQTSEHAANYLGRVDAGWVFGQTLTKNSSLYLDDLTVTYLSHAKLLEKLPAAVKEVFIAKSVKLQADGMIKYSEQSARLLHAIEQIRKHLAAGLENGKITFSERRSNDSHERDDGDRHDNHWPTLDLLSNLKDVGAVIADDRYFNKLPHWADGKSIEAKSASTLDLVAALRSAGKIGEKEYLHKRHLLRSAGYYVVTLELDELLAHLETAPINDGILRETPELKAIRENIALRLTSGAFSETEAFWLVTIRFVIFKAIRTTWANEIDLSVAISRAHWLLSIMPDPREWCQNPDDEIHWASALQQMAIQTSIMMMFTEGDTERQRDYFSWLETHVTEPLRQKHPEIWDLAIEALKQHIIQVWERGDD